VLKTVVVLTNQTERTEMEAGAAGGALSGIKIVDLARVLGGPYCTQMLADHGADVIKIEPPQGDETRDWGPPFLSDGTSAYFSGVNRNKQSIGLDLSKPQGREVLLRLLADADVGEVSKAGACPPDRIWR
jgi:crotonobetainyl-CoA:carnitine CoA-transferase CaiB-like acyl-CoA transferase